MDQNHPLEADAGPASPLHSPPIGVRVNVWPTFFEAVETLTLWTVEVPPRLPTITNHHLRYECNANLFWLQLAHSNHAG